MASPRDRPPLELGELASRAGVALGEAYERAAEPPAERMRRKRRLERAAAALPGSTPGMKWSPLIRDHAQPSVIQKAAEPVPPSPKPDTTVAEESQRQADPEARPVTIQGTLPSGEPSEVSAVLPQGRTKAGRGAGWLAGQAQRQAAGLPMSRQVFGFDAGGIAAAAQREPTQAQEDLEGSAQPMSQQEKIRGAQLQRGMSWQSKPGLAGIQAAAEAPQPAPQPPQPELGISGQPLEGTIRSAGDPAFQRRMFNEFQTSERQRYGEQDAIEAALAAQTAQQQALAEDPFAEIGAETAGQKELIGAQAEAEGGLYKAQAEMEAAATEKRAVAFEARAKENQADYDRKRALIEAAEDGPEKEADLVRLDQDHYGAMQALHAAFGMKPYQPYGF